MQGWVCALGAASDSWLSTAALPQTASAGWPVMAGEGAACLGLLAISEQQMSTSSGWQDLQHLAASRSWHSLTTFTPASATDHHGLCGGTLLATWRQHPKDPAARVAVAMVRFVGAGK
jgi:hypothetical protein